MVFLLKSCFFKKNICFFLLISGFQNKNIYPIAYARNRICIYRGYLCVAGPKKQQELKNKRIYGPSEWIPCGQHLFLIHYSKLHIIIIIDGFSIIIFFFCFSFLIFKKKKKKLNFSYLFFFQFSCFKNKICLFFSLRHFSYTLCNNEKRKQMNNKRWTHTTTTAEGFFLF